MKMVDRQLLKPTNSAGNNADFDFGFDEEDNKRASIAAGGVQSIEDEDSSEAKRRHEIIFFGSKDKQFITSNARSNSFYGGKR